MARDGRVRELLFLPPTADTQANPGGGRVTLGDVWDRDRRAAGRRRQPHRGWRGTLFLVRTASDRGPLIAVVLSAHGRAGPPPQTRGRAAGAHPPTPSVT